jgi:hypothetical protein
MAERDLASLLDSRSTISSLQSIYDSVMEDIIAELSEGLSQPGAQRVSSLTSAVNNLLQELNPNRDSLVSQWIKENVRKAFVLGDAAATQDLRSELRRVGRGTRQLRSTWTAVNATELRAITAAMQATARGKMEEIRRLIGFRIRRTQLTLAKNERLRALTRRGIIRGRTGKQIADDMASMLLGKKVPPEVKKRLRAHGFSAQDFEALEQLARKQVIRVGGRTFTVRQYADLVSRTQLREAHTLGTVARLQQNAIDHVRITRHPMPVPDECTPFAGKVFYIGPLDKDPLGFRPLRETVNGGPPFHPNCRHVAIPYVVPMRSERDVEEKAESSKAIPRRFLGKGAGDVRKMIERMDNAELRKFFNEGFEDHVRTVRVA